LAILSQLGVSEASRSMAFRRIELNLGHVSERSRLPILSVFQRFITCGKDYILGCIRRGVERGQDYPPPSTVEVVNAQGSPSPETGGTCASPVAPGQLETQEVESNSEAFWDCDAGEDINLIGTHEGIVPAQTNANPAVADEQSILLGSISMCGFAASGIMKSRVASPASGSRGSFEAEVMARLEAVLNP
jgi:hypothetical protein